MIKVVLDTNIFLSAFLFRGMVRILIDLILEDKLKLYISSDLRKEIFKKLYELHASKNILQEVTDVLDYAGLITPNTKITICRDPKDNFLLELAETTKVEYLITRDKDLLDLPNSAWKVTQIIKPEDFLPLLRSQKLID